MSLQEKKGRAQPVAGGAVVAVETTETPMADPTIKTLLERGHKQGYLTYDDINDILPDGLSSGQLSPTDYFAVFNPETGDDTALAVALRLGLAVPSNEGLRLIVEPNGP